MTLFWISVAALSGIALLVLLWRVFRASRESSNSQIVDVNLVVYREHTSELEAHPESGLSSKEQ